MILAQGSKGTNPFEQIWWEAWDSMLLGSHEMNNDFWLVLFIYFYFWPVFLNHAHGRAPLLQRQRPQNRSVGKIFNTCTSLWKASLWHLPCLLFWYVCLNNKQEKPIPLSQIRQKQVRVGYGYGPPSLADERGQSTTPPSPTSHFAETLTQQLWTADKTSGVFALLSHLPLRSGKTWVECLLTMPLLRIKGWREPIASFHPLMSCSFYLVKESNYNVTQRKNTLISAGPLYCFCLFTVKNTKFLTKYEMQKWKLF